MINEGLVVGRNVINYLVFSHSHMYMLLCFLVITCLGAIVLYSYISPNRYVLIRINIYLKGKKEEKKLYKK